MDAWEELVTSALLGTDRRPPALPKTVAGDAPVALLDAAALHTVRRRAGLRPGPAAPAPEPAPADTRRPLPEPARHRLAQLLAGRAAAAPSGGGAGPRPTSPNCSRSGSPPPATTATRRLPRRCPPSSTPPAPVPICGPRPSRSPGRAGSGWPG